MLWGAVWVVEEGMGGLAMGANVCGEATWKPCVSSSVARPLSIVFVREASGEYTVIGLMMVQ